MTEVAAAGVSAAGVPAAVAATALSGVRVLDLSRIMAGPWSAQMLADLGADVIKVEIPTKGDDTRSWAPYVGPTEAGKARASAYFWSANRGKRAIAVDMSKPEGRDVIVALASVSDVLIENYKVGGLARYGLSFEDLSAINPRLVYCSITGFGQTGPYAGRSGYDTVAQAMGGFMSLTGEPAGAPGEGPQRAGIPFVDLMTGLYAAVGILAALRYRDLTGKGQHIDLSLLDVGVASLTYFGIDHLATGRIPVRTGNANPVTSPSGLFQCRDGALVLIVGNDLQFRRFCEAIGLDGLADDARFSSNGGRVANEAALRKLVAQAMSVQDRAACVMRLDAAGIACGPVNDLQQVFADPQVVARNMTAPIEHPTLGPMQTISNPLRLSGSPIRYDVAPPALGEHTDRILNDVLGLSEQAIRTLRDKGAVA
jgi:crotonobetainyl-CoA:carnitine CoA-transferase CaiB-like acyl-CoA transferase